MGEESCGRMGIELKGPRRQQPSATETGVLGLGRGAGHAKFLDGPPGSGKEWESQTDGGKREKEERGGKETHTDQWVRPLLLVGF